MSDDGDKSESDSESGSSSGTEAYDETSMIATRQKRATAGNLYASLRANLDDEELQKELLAEDEDEDAADYESADGDEDEEDEALESSSEEEDAGPPQEGEAEDLAGEAELKKIERTEIRKKRKLQDARLKVPAWQKKKRVKLADDVKTEDGAAERPKKKSERSNWIPTADDAPMRQSERALAIANREVVHANLVDSHERSEKQHRVMQNAAEREQAHTRTDLTQEERLKVVAKIEKQTEKELGRWEREEAERQRIRDEQLKAKRRRAVEGPVVRHWSGSVLWEGERIKVRRMSHGSVSLEEMRVREKEKEAKKLALEAKARKEADGAILDAQSASAGDVSTVATSNDTTASQSSAEPPVHDSQAKSAPQPAHPTVAPTEAAQPPIPWLDGIQDYASQPLQAPNTNHQPTSTPTGAHGYVPSHPAINAPAPESIVPNTTPLQPLAQPLTPFQPPPQTYHGWPPGNQQAPTPLPPPPPSPAPLIREQAQRSLVILEKFEDLDSNASKRNKPASAVEPTATALALFGPDTYPSFNAEESRYLTAKYKKRNNEHYIATPPAPTRCPITSWTAKFRDPKTGLPYADLHTYKIIQRILAGGCQWSGLVGAWVGPRYGTMGRPAQGVPEGFASSASASVVKAEDAGG